MPRSVPELEHWASYFDGWTSSLKFLRRTPWARERVESLYVEMPRRNTGRTGTGNGAIQNDL